MMAEEHEPLYNCSSPCPIYYVQSPSTATTITTASHVLTHPPDSVFLSPHFPPDDTSESNTAHRQSDDTSHLVLSRYSSSRGSNNSFLHEKKRQVLTIVSRHGEDEQEEDLRRNLFRRFVSLDPTSSGCCIVFQLAWRLAVSLAFAFLIFFLATKPAKPHFSFKVGKIEHFNLGEGMDNSGVITNILDCNCSITMEIENYSKVFGLRIDSTILEMVFAQMTFARSQGEESYVESRSSKTITTFVNAKNKPMYAAGRGMQDLLETKQGLPIVVRVESRSCYHVIGNLIKLRYRRRTECLLFLEGLHKTKIYSSSCSDSKFHE
ncbi:delta-latroinsectotoxin-Lt1a protein [Carex rostrata]